MERHHYCFATEFLDPFPTYDPSHPGINMAAAGFAINLLRIQSLGRLPILLVGAGLALQHFDSVAASSLGLLPTAPVLMIGCPSFDQSIYAEKEIRRKQLQGEWFAETQKGQIATGMDIGANVLSILASASEPETTEGIDAVLSGMVTGMWTAFEVLVEMIWNGAVHERPNLETSMSTADKRDTGFGSTRKIRNLYRGTFKADSADIFRIVEDTRIDALALTRNVIVHSGGKVDTQFDMRRTVIPELQCFSQTSVGQHIQLTGHIVRDLIQPISSMGFDLVRIVDLWLSDHK